MVDDALPGGGRAEGPLERHADDGALEPDRGTRELVIGRGDEGDVRRFIGVHVGHDAKRAAFGKQKLRPVAPGVVGVGVARQFAFGSANLQALEDRLVEGVFDGRYQRDIGTERFEREGGEQRRPSGRPPACGCPVECDIAGDQAVRGCPLMASD